MFNYFANFAARPSFFEHTALASSRYQKVLAELAGRFDSEKLDSRHSNSKTEVELAENNSKHFQNSKLADFAENKDFALELAEVAVEPSPDSPARHDFEHLLQLFGAHNIVASDIRESPFLAPHIAREILESAEPFAVEVAVEYFDFVQILVEFVADFRIELGIAAEFAADFGLIPALAPL